MIKNKKIASHPWDNACKLEIVRYDYKPEGEIIDRGVNFFVLTLERIGAKPKASCEGHPNGFYILFEASHDLAHQIAQAGFFSIALARGCEKNWWTMDVSMPWKSETDKRRTLRWATEHWLATFPAPQTADPSADSKSPSPQRK